MTTKVTKAMVEAARADLTVLEGGVAIGWYGFRALITTLERGLERAGEAADGFTGDEQLKTIAAATVAMMANMDRERQVEQVAAAIAAGAGHGYRLGFEDGAESEEAERAALEENHG